MPNWCENKLIVVGPTKDVDAFYDKCYVDGDFKMLESFIPTPVELLESSNDGSEEEKESLVAKYGSSDWYGWRITNWGTKWDVAHSYMFDNQKSNDLQTIGIAFDTAWDAPIEGLISISAQCPTIAFFLRYEEPGMGFAGYVKLYAGQIIGQHQTMMLPRYEDIIDGPEYFYEDVKTDFENGDSDVF